MFKFTNTINGDARSGVELHQGTNPADGTALWDVPVATREDFEEAVSKATDAFQSWSKKPWEERQVIIGLMSEVLRDHRKDMSHILSLECGKPKQFADLEVQHTIDMLDFHGGQIFKLRRVNLIPVTAKVAPLTEQLVHDDDTLRLTLKYEPIGVVGAINPWNFPLVIATGKIAAGLVTGNTVIVKPSPFTPYSILKFTELVQPVLPAGVLQALNGQDELGPWIVAHPGIPKITFTGSTNTGKRIMETSSKLLKRITLELGGNDASIICKDVDISTIAPQVALGAFFNSGQLCVASKRVFVHESIYDEFLGALVSIVKSWKVGPATEGDVMLGPVQNKPQYDIVRGIIQDSIKSGHRFALGGDVEPPKGYFIQPVIIDNPPEDSRVVTEEAFGPIVPVLKWNEEDDLLSRVNDTNTGLGSSIWSSDVDYAYQLADKIESGTVWINSFGKPLAQGYFAGRKESGLGGEQGTQGLLSFCYAKTIHCYKQKEKTISPQL